MRGNLTLATAPASEPVTTAEAKAHLRVTHSSEDTLIAALITAARQHVESVTRRALINQTWDLSLDYFPDIIYLQKGRLQSVSSITYVDTDGTTQTLSSSLYTVDTKREPGRVIPAYGESWPSTRDHINCVTVRFVAGYGANASDVPQALKSAILLLIGQLFENREATAERAPEEVPLAFNALVWPYRLLEF